MAEDQALASVGLGHPGLLRTLCPGFCVPGVPVSLPAYPVHHIALLSGHLFPALAEAMA